jgi:hypothetical protein
MNTGITRTPTLIGAAALALAAAAAGTAGRGRRGDRQACDHPQARQPHDLLGARRARRRQPLFLDHRPAPAPGH